MLDFLRFLKKKKNSLVLFTGSENRTDLKAPAKPDTFEDNAGHFSSAVKISLEFKTTR